MKYMSASTDLTLDRRTLLLGLAATGAVGCGSGGVAREPPGIHELQDRIRGSAHFSYLIIPEGLTGPAPVLLGLHETSKGPQSFYNGCGWRAECATRGWIGIFPKFKPDHDGNDNVFCTHLIHRGAALAGGDLSRVYVVGHRGGGRRAYALAASNSPLLTAMGAASAAIRYTDNGFGFQDPHDLTVSMMHIHGGADAKIPVDGATVPAPEDKTRTFTSVSEGLAPWIAHIGAQPAPATIQPIPGFQGRQWSGKDKRRVVEWIETAHDHTWNPAWTRMFADFFASAPPRLR